MNDLDDLLHEAGARWRASQPEARPVTIPVVTGRRRFDSWFRRHQFWSAAVAVASAAVLVLAALGGPIALHQSAAGPDDATGLACIVNDLVNASTAIDRQVEEGFRETELARAKAEGTFLAAVAKDAQDRLRDLVDDESVAQVREVADSYERGAATLTRVGVGTPGVDPQVANSVRRTMAQDADRLGLRFGPLPSATTCSVTPIPVALQSQPATPPPAATPRIASGEVMDPVSWNMLPTPQLLRDAALVTPDFGWIKTDIDLRFTDDGGQTWRLSALPDLFDAAYTMVAFTTADHGMLLGFAASGTGMAAYTTADGGRHWAAVAPPFTDNNLDTAVPTLRAVGGALLASDGRGKQYTSLDGGDTWTNGPPVSRDGRYARVDLALRIVGSSGTQDQIDAFVQGGATSRDVNTTLPEPASFAGIDRYVWPIAARMFDGQNGVAVLSWQARGQKPTAAIYRTSDGGASWAIALTLSAKIR